MRVRFPIYDETKHIYMEMCFEKAGEEQTVFQRQDQNMLTFGEGVQKNTVVCRLRTGVSNKEPPGSPQTETCQFEEYSKPQVAVAKNYYTVLSCN